MIDIGELICSMESAGKSPREIGEAVRTRRNAQIRLRYSSKAQIQPPKSRKPKMNQRIMICDALKCTTREVFGFENERPYEKGWDRINLNDKVWDLCPGCKEKFNTHIVSFLGEGQGTQL